MRLAPGGLFRIRRRCRLRNHIRPFRIVRHVKCHGLCHTRLRSENDPGIVDVVGRLDTRKGDGHECRLPVKGVGLDRETESAAHDYLLERTVINISIATILELVERIFVNELELLQLGRQQDFHHVRALVERTFANHRNLWEVERTVDVPPQKGPAANRRDAREIPFVVRTAPKFRLRGIVRIRPRYGKAVFRDGGQSRRLEDEPIQVRVDAAGEHLFG